MNVSISGKQINIGASLQQYVKDNIEIKVKKYFDHSIAADIVFSKDGNQIRCDIMVNEGTGTGVIIKATGHDGDSYSAFDSSIVKILKQLRRYKGRIVNHHKRKASVIDFEQNTLKGKKYIISPLPHYADDQEEVNDDNPVIVAEKHTNVEHLTVSEAVMKMDLAHLPALLFVNNANGRINLVYHREDGNISWIDPENI